MSCWKSTAFGALAIGALMYPCGPSLAADTLTCQPKPPADVFVFADFPTDRSKVDRHSRDQLTFIGRLLAREDCTVVITCVSPVGGGEAADKIRSEQCNTARYTMLKFENRKPVLQRLAKQITISKLRNPKDTQLLTGNVYVSFK